MTVWYEATPRYFLNKLLNGLRTLHIQNVSRSCSRRPSRECTPRSHGAKASAGPWKACSQTWESRRHPGVGRVALVEWSSDGFIFGARNCAVQTNVSCCDCIFDDRSGRERAGHIRKFLVITSRALYEIDPGSVLFSIYFWR